MAAAPLSSEFIENVLYRSEKDPQLELARLEVGVGDFKARIAEVAEL